jgi:carboxymethylenebutenolidase
LHRQDRRDRLLPGRRVCPRARPRPRLLASSVNYGGCPKDAESLLAGACPVVGSYGAKDRTQRGAAQRLERALTANGIEHDVKEYPDAGHSFLNDHRDLMFRMLRVAGIGYHEPSAQDARHRIVSFFDTHLKS